MNHNDPILTAPDDCTQYRASSTTGSTSRPRHLLGVWAHPDDEAYLSAALMARTVKEGGRVTLVTLTDGEAGFPDDDPRPTHERARQRRNELTSAMARIGVTDVRFVGLPDGSLAEHGGEPLVETIAAVMCAIVPDVVVTFGPDGITGHDDHVHNSWAVTRAWTDVGIGDLWYATKTQNWLDRWRQVHDEFGVFMAGEPKGIDPGAAVMLLEPSGPALDRKRAVLGEHQSQTTLIASALGEDSYRSWIRQEAFRRPSPADLAAATCEHSRGRRSEVQSASRVSRQRLGAVSL